MHVVSAKESMADNKELDAVKKAIALNLDWARESVSDIRFSARAGVTNLYLSITQAYAQLTLSSSSDSNKKNINIYRNLSQSKDLVLLELIKLKNHVEHKEKERETALEEFLRYTEPRPYTSPAVTPRENVVTLSNEDMRDQGRIE